MAEGDDVGGAPPNGVLQHDEAAAADDVLPTIALHGGDTETPAPPSVQLVEVPPSTELSMYSIALDDGVGGGVQDGDPRLDPLAHSFPWAQFLIPLPLRSIVPEAARRVAPDRKLQMLPFKVRTRFAAGLAAMHMRRWTGWWSGEGAPGWTAACTQPCGHAACMRN